jgi:hypothetical protein
MKVSEQFYNEMLRRRKTYQKLLSRLTVSPQISLYFERKSILWILMLSRLARLKTFEQSSITKVYEVVKAYNKNKMTEVPENRRSAIKILHFNSYYLGRTVESIFGAGVDLWTDTSSTLEWLWKEPVGSRLSSIVFLSSSFLRSRSLFL